MTNGTYQPINGWKLMENQSNQYDEIFNSCIIVAKMTKIVEIWSYCKYSQI